MSNTDCGVDKSRPFLYYKTGRFNDIAQSINFMQKYLAQSITLEEKCKRYAVASELAFEERLPLRKTIIEVANMNEGDLDRQYDLMNITRIGWLFMSTIDKYRITRLGPPIIDLVECLKKLDTPAARTYLNNTELSIIINMYKQVLDHSDTMNIDQLDFQKFYPSFRQTLKNLFDGYMDIDSILGKTATDVGIEDAGSAGSSSSNRKRSYDQFKTSTSTDQFYSKRENARLVQQRIRMAKPEMVQKYRETRRQRDKENRLLLKKTAATSEEAEAQRLARKRLDRINERQRQRRRDKRAKRQQQLAQALDSVRNLKTVKRAEWQSETPRPRPDAAERLVSQLVYDGRGSPIVNPETSSQPVEGSGVLFDEDASNQDKVAAVMVEPHVPAVASSAVHNSQRASTQMDHDHSRFFDLTYMWPDFEPETQEERQFHQDLIDCANQPDDSDIITRFLSTRTSTSTDRASPCPSQDGDIGNE